ncbi:MAG: tetratricopeptide repeat protein [Candidatus Zixiibacteriota bacterium]
MTTGAKSDNQAWLLATITYYLVVVLYLLASLLPQYRLWGFSHWAYYEWWVQLGLLVVAAIVPPLVWSVRRRVSDVSYPLVAGAVTVVMGLSFYVFRARTHFDGDGYLVKSMLAEENPLIKFTNFGAVVVNRFVYGLLSDIGPDPSLLTFYLISFVAGIVFIISVAAAAEVVVDKSRHRTLFLLGGVSGGYMLLFFGHVENYSLFAATVGVFCTVGVWIAARRLNRWVILLPLGVALLLHVLGVTLIPAAGYILIRRTRLAAAISNAALTLKIAIVSVVAAALIAAFSYLYSTRYYFRFAIVPLFSDRFTLNGYTLFSVTHLMDLLNLVMFLLPGLPVALLALMKTDGRRALRLPKIRFLLMVLVFSLAAVVMFDPKLGMPRDWDLFAFFAIPLTFLVFSMLLKDSGNLKMAGSIAVLVIALGLVALFSRAYNQTSDEISVGRMRRCIELDPLRNRSGVWVMVGYFNDRGDTLAAQSEFDNVVDGFPEWQLNKNGSDLIGAGEYRKAIGYLRQALSINPGYYLAYSNLGCAYLYLKQYDSAIAYYEIANGINPGNSTVTSNMSGAHYYLGHYAEAEEHAVEALRLDSTNVAAVLNLAMTYKATGRYQEYVGCLEKGCCMGDVPLKPIQDLLIIYINQGKFDRASSLLPRAISRGMDTSQVRMLRERYPQLR